MMNANELKINLPEEVVSYLQRLAFEYDAYKDNIVFLLDSKRDDTSLLDSANFKRYTELQAKTKAEYEEAKLDAQNRFIPENLRKGHILNWEIKFASREMLVTVVNTVDVEASLKNKLTVAITEDDINYLQRFAYEYELYKDNIAFLLDSRRDDIGLLDSVNFKKYTEQQTKIKVEYEKAQLDAQEKYVPAELRNDHKVNWEIDFAAKEMTITVLCDCGLEILKTLKGEK